MSTGVWVQVPSLAPTEKSLENTAFLRSFLLWLLIKDANHDSNRDLQYIGVKYFFT